MTKTFSLLAMCFIMILSLQAAGFFNPQDGPQASASDMASTYVPIESWVYPAFERLAAEGYLPAAFFSLRPWTRMDCARLVDEAEELVDEDKEQIAAKPAAFDAAALLDSLKEEFASELALRAGARNVEFRVEEQTEWRRFPLLSPAPQHDAAFTLQLTYRPVGRVRR